MRKVISIAAASLLIAATLTGCGSSSSSSSESSAPEATTVEATTEAETDAETSEGTSEDEDEELKPVDLTLKDCTEADFTGKWECKKIVTSEETMEGEYFGIPIYAIMNVTFNEDKTGVVGSSLAATPEEDKPEEFKWELSGNQATITATDDDEPAYAGFDGDNLVFFDENKYAVYYFDKVDDFTPFDINEFYGSFSDETTEEGAASEDSTESATEVEATTSAE